MGLNPILSNQLVCESATHFVRPMIWDWLCQNSVFDVKVVATFCMVILVASLDESPV